MAKMTPLLMSWMFRKTATSPCFRSHCQRGEDVGDDPTRLMEESGQGPKRAFAIDVTRPVGIQPDIPNTEETPPPKGQLLR